MTSDPFISDLFFEQTIDDLLRSPDEDICSIVTDLSAYIDGQNNFDVDVSPITTDLESHPLTPEEYTSIVNKSNEGSSLLKTTPNNVPKNKTKKKKTERTVSGKQLRYLFKLFNRRVNTESKPECHSNSEFVPIITTRSRAKTGFSDKINSKVKTSSDNKSKKSLETDWNRLEINKIKEQNTFQSKKVMKKSVEEVLKKNRDTNEGQIYRHLKSSDAKGIGFDQRIANHNSTHLEQSLPMIKMKKLSAEDMVNAKTDNHMPNGQKRAVVFSMSLRNKINDKNGKSLNKTIDLENKDLKKKQSKAKSDDQPENTKITVRTFKSKRSKASSKYLSSVFTTRKKSDYRLREKICRRSRGVTITFGKPSFGNENAFNH